MLRYAIIIILLFTAVVLWMVTGAPFPEIKAYVDGLSPDGEVEQFTAKRFESALWKGRLFSTALVAMAAALFFAGRVAKKNTKKGSQSAGVGGIFRELRKLRAGIFKRSSSSHLLVVAALILCGTTLRIYMLQLPISYDEAFTYTQYASKPFWVIVSDYSYPNNHVLHTILAKISTGILGLGTWQLRLPALLCGVLCLPLVYVFVRSTFNRYIALQALALVAALGGLVEYSSLARGYSLSWLLMLLGLILVRGIIKSKNELLPYLLGLVLAFAMWSVPTMIYGGLLVLLFLLIRLIEGSGTNRVAKMGPFFVASVTTVVTSLILYAPILIMNDLDMVLNHPATRSTGEGGLLEAGAKFGAVVLYWLHSASEIILMLALAAILFAGFVSSKYRSLLFSTAISMLLIGIVKPVIGPPRIWNFTLFILAIGASVGLFYFLKFLQDQVFSKFGKRQRTLAASILVFGVFAWYTVESVPNRDGFQRYSDGERFLAISDVFNADNGRLLVDFPWEAPIEFNILAAGKDIDCLYRPLISGKPIQIILARSQNQTLASVLDKHGLQESDLSLESEPYFVGKQMEVYRGTIK